ncbi:MAG: CDP-alcohol phosphatidyltransferase family protein [bacterium]
MARIKYLLPDILTGINICIGFICIILVMHASRIPGAFHFNYIYSAWLIIIAGLLDILDGSLARWFGKTGSFGVEFDSIADFTVFAVAPSILLYTFFYERQSIFYLIVPLFYLVSAAYRLARFNADALEASRKKIVGLGTPISAAIVVAVVLLVANLYQQGIIQEISANLRFAITILILFNVSLMILPVEFITAYEYCFRDTRRVILLIIAIVAPLLLLRFKLPSLSILIVGIIYIAESLGRRLVRRPAQRKKSKS